MSAKNPQKYEEKGLRCPKCHCRHLYVLRTRAHTNGRVMRQRECRHCGQRLITYESLPAGYRQQDMPDIADLSESQKDSLIQRLYDLFGKLF